MHPSWDDAPRVPVTFLAGYLGAGKTTVVNHLLATTDRRLALLVNDLGTVAVDAERIARRTDDVVELNDGCVCCSLAGGFTDALEEIRQRPRPDHLVIELSGVAEPARVVGWASTAGFALDAVVTLADLDQLHLRAADPRVADTVERQLAAAHLVLATKGDLAAEADRAASVAVIERFAPTAPVVEIVDGAIDPAALLGGINGAGPELKQTAEHRNPHRAENVEPQCDDRAALAQWLSELGDDVVRVKGTAVTGDGQRWNVDRVGTRQRITAAEAEATAGPIVVIRLV